MNSINSAKQNIESIQQSQYHQQATYNKVSLELLKETVEIFKTFNFITLTHFDDKYDQKAIFSVNNHENLRLILTTKCTQTSFDTLGNSYTRWFIDLEVKYFDKQEKIYPYPSIDCKASVDSSVNKDELKMHSMQLILHTLMNAQLACHDDEDRDYFFNQLLLRS